MTSMPGGMALAQRVGIPMPRFTKSPSFISATARRMIPSRLRAIRLPPSAFRLPNRAALDALLPRRDNEAIDEDARGMNAFRVEIPGLDDLLDLRDRDPCRRDGHGIEVAGGLPVDEVSQAVPFPRR